MKHKVLFVVVFFLAFVTSANAQPTVTLTASPTVIKSGESSTLSWSSTGAISAQASWTTSAIEVTGSETVALGMSKTFFVTVTDDKGRTASAETTVTMVFQDCWKTMEEGISAMLAGAPFYVPTDLSGGANTMNKRAMEAFFSKKFGEPCHVAGHPTGGVFRMKVPDRLFTDKEGFAWVGIEAGRLCVFDANGNLLALAACGNNIDMTDIYYFPSPTKATQGKDGYTPIKGVDYFDGADGKDGKDGVCHCRHCEKERRHKDHARKDHEKRAHHTKRPHDPNQKHTVRNWIVGGVVAGALLLVWPDAAPHALKACKALK